MKLFTERDDFKTALATETGDAFVRDLCLLSDSFYPRQKNRRIHTKVVKDFPLSRRIALPSYYGDSRRLLKPDLLFFVAPGEDREFRLKCFTAIVEVVADIGELYGNRDLRLLQSLTDYLFVGVPSDLVEDAVFAYRSYPCVGVVNAEDGAIRKMPSFQIVNSETREEVLREFAYCVHGDSVKERTILH